LNVSKKRGFIQKVYAELAIPRGGGRNLSQKVYVQSVASGRFQANQNAGVMYV
jgi:hypothetical protein